MKEHVLEGDALQPSHQDIARRKLPSDVYSFLAAGSGSGSTLKRNRQKLDELAIIPRVLRGHAEVSTKLNLLGSELKAPILIAPSAYQGLLSKEGELDMLRAATAFNTIMIHSMFSSIDHQQVLAIKKNPIWLQMYLLKDRLVNQRFIQMASKLQFDALVVTVDAPVYAKKSKEHAKPLQFPPATQFTHLADLGIPIEACLQSKTHFASLLDSACSWKDIDWIVDQTDLPIILKGILDPRDTEIALSYPQVKGIVISNHGGRQLDACVSAIEMMRAHKQLVGEQCSLFLDGGISSGMDVFKALALGADATLIGRAAFWALAAGGVQAVFETLTRLQQELEEAMILTGCASLKGIGPDFIK